MRQLLLGQNRGVEDERCYPSKTELFFCLFMKVIACVWSYTLATPILGLTFCTLPATGGKMRRQNGGVQMVLSNSKVGRQ